MFLIFTLGFPIVLTINLLPPLTPVKDYQEPLISCLRDISKNYNFSSTTINTIYYNGEPKLKTYAFSDDVIKMFVENKIPIVIIDDIRKINEFSHIKMLVLIIVEKCEWVLDVIKNIQFNKKHFYLVIIKDAHSKQCQQVLIRINPIISTYDITFIIYNPTMTAYNFLSIIPEIDDSTCNITNAYLVLLKTCNYGTLHKNTFRDIFPSKSPKNFKNCPFKVGMATLLPYSTIKNKELSKDMDSIEDINGSDLEILKIIADQVNASLELHYIFREEENPYLHMQFIEYVKNGSLDVCAGGLYRIYGDVVDYSDVYSKQEVLWVYYVERDIRSWQSLVVKMRGLFYFVLYFLWHSALWKLISVFDKQTVSFFKTILRSFGAIAGASSLENAVSLKQKLLNICYLVLCLHFSAYIGAQIYSYLTIQGPPRIYKTVDELSVSDKKLYLIFASKFFVKDKKYEIFANTSKDCISFQDCVEMIFEHKGSTILLDGYLLPVQANTAINDEARVLSVSETIRFAYHIMVLRKESPLALLTKNKLMRLFEAGICQKLYNEAIGITVVHKAQITTKNIMSNSYSCTVGCEITMSQFAGVYYIWIFGCILSCCIFVLEILLQKNKEF